MKRRRCIGLTILSVFMALLIVGCESKPTDQVVGRDGIGEEISDVETKEEREIEISVPDQLREAEAPDQSIRAKVETYNYANSTNYYWRNYVNDGGFKGYKRDGSGKTKYRIKDFEGLLAVTEDAVYYVRGNGKKKSSLLCQVPIEKGADGTDLLDLEKENVLLEEKDGIIDNDDNPCPGIYVDEKYIVYLTYGESEQVVRYDRTSKEITRYTPCDDQVTVIAYAGYGFLVLVSDYGGFFRMELESGEIQRFEGGDEGKGFYTMVPWMGYGHQFIYGMGSDQLYAIPYSSFELWTYNVETQKKKKILEGEDLYPICGGFVQSEKGSQEMDEVSLDQLFYLGNRLYIQVQVRWTNEKKEYCRYMMFSVDLSGEDQELEYEKDMTECMWNNCYEDYDDTNEEYLNSGRCRAVVEGKAFFVLNKKGKWEQQVGCYDLVDRTFQIVDKKMGEYSMPYFNSQGPYGYDDWELEEWLGAIE